MQPLDKKQLEEDFNKDMFRILEKEFEAGLNSTRFRQMIERYGELRQHINCCSLTVNCCQIHSPI